MISINGRNMFYKKKIILLLNKTDQLFIKRDLYSRDNMVELRLKNSGHWNVARVSPNDPPFTIRRRLLGGVIFEVISHFENDYVHVSPGRE